MIPILASVRHRAVHHAVTRASTQPRLYYALHVATGRGNALSFLDGAWAWLCFYRALLPMQASLVVATIDVVTKALAPTMHQVNARFGTRFRTGAEGVPEERALGWHALPKDVRRPILFQLRTAFTQQATFGRLRQMMADCNDLYDCFVEGS
jgi:hypothetical protein